MAEMEKVDNVKLDWSREDQTRQCQIRLDYLCADQSRV